MKAEVELKYNNKDISEEINKYLISLSYTDYAHGKKDDLQISLENSSGLWTGRWFPGKGAKLNLKIFFNGSVLDPGVFAIDDLTSSEPPSVFTMKALSSVISTGKSSMNLNGLKTRQKRTYENITFGQVVRDIAVYHGLSHVYSVSSDPVIERLTQDESDLTLLKKLTNEYGLKLKLHSEKIVVYSGKLYEEKPPTITIKKGFSNIESYSFNTKAHDTYSSVILLYEDIDTKSVQKFRWAPDGLDPYGEVLSIDKGKLTTLRAQEIAKNALRKKNESGDTGNFKLLGNPLLRAGINVQAEGFGNFDGKYSVDEVNHTLSGGYTTTLKLKKILGY